MKTRRLFVVLGAVLLAAGVSMAQSGVRKKRPPPHEYGRVVMNNYSSPEETSSGDANQSPLWHLPAAELARRIEVRSSTAGRIAPVVFDHWLHRATYTCRLCHVDIGFAMSANGTGVRAADNVKGEYCGACHNGKTTHAGQRIFAACSNQPKAEDAKTCSRCHSLGMKVGMRNDFAEFTGKFPREKFGNGIGWIETEATGLTKLTDSVQGVSAKTAPMKNPRDLTIEPKAVGMPDILFSHDKHAVWNGCELCHPDLFPSVQKGGGTKFSMNEIFEGRYCGACHGKVAFPLMECRRCHSKPVAIN